MKKSLKKAEKRRRSRSTLKMYVCCPLLVTLLLSVFLLSSSAGGFRINEGPVQRRPGAMNAGAELTAHLVMMESGMGLKRSVPALDRVGLHLMEAKQRKGAEFPQRRVNVPPIDRIGMNSLPNRMGHASSKRRRTRPLS